MYRHRDARYRAVGKTTSTNFNVILETVTMPRNKALQLSSDELYRCSINSPYGSTLYQNSMIADSSVHSSK